MIEQYKTQIRPKPSQNLAVSKSGTKILNLGNVRISKVTGGYILM